MNLGLENLNARTSVPSMESLFAEYVACEALVEQTNAFVAYGEQLNVALENVCSIGNAAKRYHSAESMAVINSLVGAEFGGRVSMETIKETATKVWNAIKEWFAKAWTWIKTIYNRIMNFFFNAKKRLEALQKKLNDSTAEIKPFEFSSLKEESDYNTAAAAIKKATEDNIGNLTTAAISKFSLEKKSISTKAAALQEITTFLYALKAIDTQKKALEKSYADAKIELKHAEGDDNIKAGKLSQKRIASQIKVANKYSSAEMKSLASFMASCKLAG